MLIRTQDKRTLIESDKFRLIYSYDCEVRADLSEKITRDRDNVLLGKYDTDEKAMTVIDEIQDAMCNCLKATSDGFEFKVGKMVFQMPDDIRLTDEVLEYSRNYNELVLIDSAIESTQNRLFQIMKNNIDGVSVKKNRQGDVQDYILNLLNDRKAVLYNQGGAK